MKYRAYPTYKDSGVEWLGEIPSEWNRVKTAYLFSSAMGQTILKEDLIEDGKYPVYSATAEDKFFGKVNKATVILDKNDIVIPARGNSIGYVKLVKDTSTTTQTTIYCKPLTSKTIPKYAYYYMLGLKDNLFYFVQTAIPQITVSEVLSNPLLVPPLQEQQTIANYLDNATQKIDTLIQKQENLIKLLKEKRQAEISHAVTRGLNPNVKFKDSGIEWLGDVPEYWGVNRLKHLTRLIIDGAHFTPTYVEKGVPFLRVTDLHNKVINKDKVKYIPLNEHNELIKRCKPEKGDLLLSKNGTIGLTKIIDWDWNFSIFVSLCLIKFKTNKFLADYFQFIFQSSAIEEQLFHSSKKTSVTNLHLDKINELCFSVPSIEEQKSIVSYLEIKTSKIDKLIEKANKSIKLLKEKRTALISAAVTGKIDVREAV